MTYVARYWGKCRACEKSIITGQLIRKHNAGGYRHTNCVEATKMATTKMRCVDVSAVPGQPAPKALTLGAVYDIDLSTVSELAGAPCYDVTRDDGVKRVTNCSRFVPADQAFTVVCIENETYGLTYGKRYTAKPHPQLLGCYLVDKEGWMRYYTSRFVFESEFAAWEKKQQERAPVATPAPAPAFVCRCVICDKKLENVIGLMAIAYPYTQTAQQRTPQGFDKELQIACEACSREIASFVAHKKKPLPDPEDFW